MRRLMQIRRRRGRIDPVISRIEVSPSVITLDANDRQKFTAIAYDQFDQPINSGVSFQWSTSDPSVAVVDSGGLVEAYAGGSVDIVAAANGVTGSSALVVEGEVADVVASYDQILLLKPDVDVLLQLPRYRGQDMLFVDSAGTTVVSSVGDPIGGVWSLARGEVAAVAPSAVQRPTWQGVEEGAYFDGGSRLTGSLPGDEWEKPYSNVSFLQWLDVGTPWALRSGADRLQVTSSTIFRLRGSSGFDANYGSRYSPLGDGHRVVSGVFDEQPNAMLKVDGIAPALGTNYTDTAPSDRFVMGSSISGVGGEAWVGAYRWSLFFDSVISEAGIDLLEALND